MSLLTTILAFITTKFAYVFTAVSGAFTTILGEIPDDEIAALHTAMVAAGNKLKAGGTVEEAFTEGLNALVAAEKAELSKVSTALLNAFIEATKPV